MKNRIALIVLGLLCLGLGIAVITIRNNAVEQKRTDDDAILGFSNKWVETSTKLEDQKQVTATFVDVDPNTVCFDLEDARRKLTPRTKALMVMHSWGLPCEMDGIAEYAREKGLILLEDAAQAHGAAMQGRMMGTWGAMGAYSFQLSKVMPTVEGGIGMYQTREYFERAAAFGHYEDPAKSAADSPVRQYEGTGFGQKYRMHPFAAAVARQQLRGLEERGALVAANVRKLNGQLERIRKEVTILVAIRRV